MYVIQERINQQWVILGKVTCLERAMAHLQELREVAPEPPGGGRYRVSKELMTTVPLNPLVHATFEPTEENALRLHRVV